MSVELIFNASDNDVAPDFPILLQNDCKKVLKPVQKNSFPKYNRVSEELTFNNSDNDDTPDSPI